MGLLLLAAWALRRELSGLDVDELLQQFLAFGWRAVTLGLLCTAGSFAALAATELLALRYAGHGNVPRRVGATTSFVANAFSQSIGLALLTGAAVRLRGYARRGLDAPSVARVSAFVTLTMSLGLLATGAFAFLASDVPLRLFHRSVAVRPAGVLLGLIVVAYLAWSAFGSREVVNRGSWEIRRPPLSLAVMQLSLSSLDWLLTGTVLFCVMPASLDLGYGTVMRSYLVAQTVGTLSHVPGGAGVFELVMLTLLGSELSPVQRAALVASLVLFRVLYYLVPLIIAIVIAAAAELMRAHRRAYAAAAQVG
ncbi:MAG: hypothetical protein JWN53_2030 [Gemmatimonadetes bacterium]|nr:hypothetical protein [Gemmatimonadota bacterium]